tara:strand:+ start:32353 stop:32889 length:537 start_codon:yes stop_codon:yes gene_type:complete
MPKKICVFCASSNSKDSIIVKETRKIGKIIASNNMTLVYGGAKIGLMGLIAKEVLKNNGKVIGVIPDILSKKEIINTDITKLYRVKNMHERKKKMYDLSQIFIALPGGIGTLEELSEIITWKSLNIKKTSIHLMNLNGFYDPLINQFHKMNDNKFLYFDIFKEIIIHDNTNTLEKYLK